MGSKSVRYIREYRMQKKINILFPEFKEMNICYFCTGEDCGVEIIF